MHESYKWLAKELDGAIYYALTAEECRLIATCLKRLDELENQCDQLVLHIEGQGDQIERLQANNRAFAVHEQELTAQIHRLQEQNQEYSDWLRVVVRTLVADRRQLARPNIAP